ncbi:tripartite tricarboxylate transporter TctB family protein [Tianweitania populi]|uniref:DUF1468 domain-containing protein n=1 Tax=Tianweitania populi TaxID=1607949 RepID=A0A8J3GLV8_9HYPH|nr:MULTISPECIES: tripartite tricarboxylate transporter TctB family protein [Tianweitania]GHD19521.1 hypothetical protein GCM10016234_31320 [Tianweitania populi]
MTNLRLGGPDLGFGAFLVLVAAGTFAATWNLPIGTAAEMGPGYFPWAIALILLAFGLFFTVKGLTRSHAGIEPMQWRPITLIGIAVALFALVVEGLGLGLASLATIIVAAWASRESRFFEVIVFALFMSAAAILLFIKVLALPVPLWPW